MAIDEKIERILQAVDDLTDDEFTTFRSEMLKRARAKKRPGSRGGTMLASHSRG